MRAAFPAGLTMLFPAAMLFHAAAVAAAAQAGEAGQRECDLRFRPVRVAGEVTSHLQAFPGSRPDTRNVFAGGGVDAYCANSDQQVRSDSAEHYEDTRILVLIGRVRYTEARVTMLADRVEYYMAEERLVGIGNVSGRTNTGTRFRGPRATYLRAKPGVRDRSRLEAGGRPDVWISAADAGADTTLRDSTHVVADTVTSDNDSLVYARGRVEVSRTDLTATSDSAMLDQGRELAALRRGPRVKGLGERDFTLTGEEIDIFSRDRRAERVRSAGRATATSEDVILESDTIDLRILDDRLSQAVAWGPGRARARQTGRDIMADSIDVSMPGQVLRTIHAVGTALAQSLPDSTRIRSAEHDWFAGDTIIAEFDTAAVRDTSSAAIRRLQARGSARSWQQAARDEVTPPDSTPAINYVTGRVITAEFNSQRELQRVHVADQVSGILLQPAADSTRRAPPRRPPSPPEESAP